MPYPSAFDWPESAEQIREVLRISSDMPLLCMWTKDSGDTCENPINAAGRKRIETLLGAVVAGGSWRAADAVLKELSEVVLCSRRHKKYSHMVLQRWQDFFFVEAEEFSEGEEHSEYDEPFEAKEELSEEEFVKGVEDLSESEEFSEAGEQCMARCNPATPSPTKSIGRIIEVEPTPPSAYRGRGAYPGIRVKHTRITTDKCIQETFECDISQEMSDMFLSTQNLFIGPPIKKTTPRKPAAKKQTTAEPTMENITHTFIPYGDKRTIEEINQGVKRIIQSSLHKKDLKSWGKKGIIYFYTFGDADRNIMPHVKIGFSEDAEKRMKSWKQKCGYTPDPRFAIPSELYVRVESLVHAHLYATRKKEPVCPGCKTGHVEWFEISLFEATSIAVLWSEWAWKQPYFKNGNLKKPWQNKLQSVDLKDPDCWKKFVHDHLTG